MKKGITGSQMDDVRNILNTLKSLGNPKNVEGMARFGMTPSDRSGVKPVAKPVADDKKKKFFKGSA